MTGPASSPPPPPPATPAPDPQPMPGPGPASGPGEAAARPGRPLPPPFVAIVGYTLRACLPARRWFLVALPCLGAMGFGWLAQFVHHDEVDAFADVAEQGLFGLIVPLTCLVIGDAVLSADVRAGTFQLTWLSPVHFAVVTAGRWLGGWLVALVTLVPALGLAAVIAGVPEAAGPMMVAGMAGAAGYVALFLLLGVVTRRSTVWALAIVLMVERLVGAELSGIAQLSPLWESGQAFAGLWDEGGGELLREGVPHGWSAVVRLGLLTIVWLLVATWRMPRMRPLSGDD